MTDKVKEQLEHLSEMRSLMEESSQFLSLSGLSGVFAGIYALVGAVLASMQFNFIYGSTSGYSDQVSEWSRVDVLNSIDYTTRFYNLVFIAAGVLLASLLTGYILTARKAKKNNKELFTKTSLKMLAHLFLPLVMGGLFCIALIMHGYYGAVAPAMLLFYGAALLSAGKYTFRDIRYLGACEMILGVIAAFFIGKGLLFWAIGFGVLHIVYGLAMYIKYERNV